MMVFRIGVLRKERSEDPYEVVGLGLPIEWRDGFFTFVSYKAGSMPELPGHLQAGAERLAWPDSSQEQIPDSDYHARIRVLAEIARRQGQPAFRTRLLAAYGGRCAITGCDVPDALEAAHLRPYRGPTSNTLANGILLRADLHTLLDKQLIAIRPDSRSLELSQELRGTAYSSLAGKRISDPQDPATAPAAELLHQSWTEFMNAEQERSRRSLINRLVFGGAHGACREPSVRTTSCARRTNTDRRMAIMPARGPARQTRAGEPGARRRRPHDLTALKGSTAAFPQVIMSYGVLGDRGSGGPSGGSCSGRCGNSRLAGDRPVCRPPREGGGQSGAGSCSGG